MAMDEPGNHTEKKERPRRFSWPRRWVLWAAAGVLAAIAVVLIVAGKTPLHQTGRGGQSPAPPGVPVVAVPAKETDFHIYITGLGSVTPLNTVVVKTRVDGQLMDVLFREGQIVEGGELLARIDPRPFEVQLLQAEGQMARDQEQLKNARLDLQRYRVLWDQDSIPKQQLDTQEALVRQLEGTVKSDQGQIDSAKLQLFYCRITSPIGGRVGLRLVDPGNIVHASDANGLVVITQLEPITVVFSIPEDSLPAILSRLGKGDRPPVEAYDREMKKKIAAGSLLTADNQIDPTTGTVRLKALFPNRNHELFPNQFVNARLLMDVRRKVVVVPASAIQRGPQGAFVYVVKADRTAEVRPVKVGEVQEGEASVPSGLSPAELVVVEGAERLREGARVELRPPSAGEAQRGY